MKSNIIGLDSKERISSVYDSRRWKNFKKLLRHKQIRSALRTP